MASNIERLSIELAVGTDPPNEFRILSKGINSTLKGDVLFDEEAAQSVLAAAADWKTSYSLDYEHDAVNPMLGGPKPAAGWFSIELRDGELWAVNVQWTERAAGYLRAREYRYISPTLTLDRETRRAVELINVALVNLPAMKGLTPLVANRTGVDSTTAEDPMTKKNPKVALAADAPAPDAAPADAPVDAPDANDPVEGCSDAIEACIASCDACLKECAAMTVDASVDDAVKAAAQSVIDACNAAKAALSEALPAFDSSSAPAPADQQMAASILALTGARNITAALGVIAAGKAALDELTALRAKQAEEAKLSAAQERASIIERLSNEKKITPAQRQWAEAVDLAALKSFAAVAPVITALSAAPLGEPAKGTEKRWEDHTAMELHRLHAENPELYAALRADRDQRNAR